MSKQIKINHPNRRHNKMSKSYRNCEINVIEAEVLRIFLKNEKIKYEASQADNLIHFEILCDDDEAHRINDFLDTL